MSQKQILSVLVGTSLALATQPALAVDVDAFVRHLQTAKIGGLMYPGDATADGENVVVDSMFVQLDDGIILLDGQFTFAGITMQPDRGYVVGSITAPKIVFRDQSTGIAFATLQDLSLDDYVVPGQSGPVGELYPFDLHTGLFAWLESPLTVEAFSIEIKPTFTNETLRSVAMSASAKGLTVHLPDTPSQSDALAGTLSALGVDELTFDFSDSYVWQDNGLLAYSNQTGLGEFGEARTEIVLTGLTPDKLEDIRVAWITAQTDGAYDPRASTAWAAPILGLAAEGASFRFDVGPLLPQVVDHLGRGLGGRDVLASMVEEAIMTEVEALDLPPLTALVRPALRAFLADPSSLEARIDPPTPVTFISLTAATMINKAGIVPLLGLTVTANEPPRADSP